MSKYTIEEILQVTGRYAGIVVGSSMAPMLKERRDTVVVEAIKAPLQPMDVALYKRGEEYVLHRILSVVKDGYVTRGDNCYGEEFVTKESILGVLTEFYKGEKRYLVTDKHYLRYVKRRVGLYPLRRFLRERI